MLKYPTPMHPTTEEHKSAIKVIDKKIAKNPISPVHYIDMDIFKIAQDMISASVRERYSDCIDYGDYTLLPSPVDASEADCKPVYNKRRTAWRAT